MRMRETEEAVIVEPARPATASVIWLHGLGADGHDFAPIVPELRAPDDVRYVFPHAPVRPVTINNGMKMRAWYDILSLTSPRQQDTKGIRDSEQLVLGFMQREAAAGIAPARIVLAGFSQGGAIALHVGLRFPQRLAGILALSTYLPLAENVAKEASAANRDVPILMCHGTHDPVLHYDLGAGSRDYLTQLGYPVEWHEYPMQHQVCPEEIAEMGRWLRQQLDAPRIIVATSLPRLTR